jgi:FtsH-binding integral membrane protein
MYPQTSSLGAIDIQEGVRLAMRRVYMWMTLGLLVTAGVSLVTLITVPVEVMLTLMLPAIIVELVVVLALSFAINRISPTVAVLGFFFYAALNGFTLTPIVFAYTGSSIGLAFFATASLFGAMTIIGYTTKMDLSGFGSFLFMGLIGLIIASIANLFFASTTLDYIITYAGILIFIGLTVYDTQWIKNATTQAVVAGDTQLEARIGVMGALRLYLDFINLFLRILRATGRRR